MEGGSGGRGTSVRVPVVKRVFVKEGKVKKVGIGSSKSMYVVVYNMYVIPCVHACAPHVRA